MESGKPKVPKLAEVKRDGVVIVFCLLDKGHGAKHLQKDCDNQKQPKLVNTVLDHFAKKKPWWLRLKLMYSVDYRWVSFL